MTQAQTQTRNRAAKRRAPAGIFDELIVDNFAGGGGASEGIEAAVNRAVDVAINHNREAVEMHSANHPNTLHLCEDVWRVDPIKATGGRPVGLAWFSPDCRHFSRAKGGQPVLKKIRGLAWIVVKWARAVKPRVICLENVREFEDWGPLGHAKGTDGKHLHTANGEPAMLPDKTRKGLTFRRWVGCLRALGYVVEWRQLNAADYGAPTHRRRLFLVARRDGKPIVWPAPTHGKGRRPYHTAAECIDWSIPCPSIFDRKRPLAEKTLRRIAMGLKRYVIDNPRPYIVPVTHVGERRVHPIDEPMPTVTGANRGEMALVTPYIARTSSKGWDGPAGGASPADEPARTILPKDGAVLVTPYLVQRNGEAAGQSPRAMPVDRPMGTVTPDNNSGVLVSAMLSAYHHSKGDESRCTPLREPARTLDTQNRYGVVSAFLAKHYGGVVGCPIATPLPTTTARGTQNQIVTANMVHLNHGDKPVSAMDEPARTVTAGGNHAALVYSFLVKYFGCGIGQELSDPLHTVTSRDRFGLVTVTINGEPYVIVDTRRRHERGTMNKLEAAYAAHLDLRIRAGEVRAWWFERFTWLLATDCRYTPDFLVQLASGELEFHDTKGHVEDDAVVKMRTMAQQFPALVLSVTRAKGGGWDCGTVLKAAQIRRNALVVQFEMGAVGAVNPFREQLGAPIQTQIDDYIAYLETRRRDDMYCYVARCRLERIAREAGWKTLADITPASFEAWRAKAAKTPWRGKLRTPKTLNQYLEAALAFLEWAVTPGERIAANPLAKVGKVTATDNLDYRRSATVEEFRKLLAAVNEDRRRFYLFAVYVPLRRETLRTLVWGDLYLNDSPPWVRIRADQVKSRRVEKSAIRADVAAVMRDARKGAEDDDLVFPKMPTCDDLRMDLEAAGVRFSDAAGRKRLDLHAFRRTLISWLQASGVPMEQASATLHHKDPRTTRRYYHEKATEPMAGVVEAAPSILQPDTTQANPTHGGVR